MATGLGYGTLYKIKYDGTGFAILHVFGVGTDGKFPTNGLLVHGTTIYGLTQQGGTSFGSSGTLYSISTNGSNYQVIHNFAGYPDGTAPNWISISPDGTTLAIVTGSGGPVNTNGAVVTLPVSATPSTAVTVLHGFSTLTSSGSSQTNTDGSSPYGVVFSADGTMLYGTTQQGGSSGNGVVYSIQVATSTFTVLHTFTAESSGANADGATPDASPALSPDGTTLYGIAKFGGSGGKGTLFSIAVASGAFATVESFTGGATDGGTPVALSLSGNTLYGTTAVGGSNGAGTLWQMTLAAKAPASSDREAMGVITTEGQAGGGGPGMASSITVSGPTSVLGTLGGNATFSVTASEGTGTTGTITFESFSSGIFNSYSPLYYSFPVVNGTFFGAINGGGANGYGQIFTGTIPPPGTSSGVTFSYQWYAFDPETRAQVEITGATSPTLTLTGIVALNNPSVSYAIGGAFTSAGTGGVAASNGYYYGPFFCGVEDSNGNSASSAVAIIKVPPTFVEQPVAATVAAGKPANFGVSVDGSGPFTYQWYFNGVAITGGSVSGSSSSISIPTTPGTLPVSTGIVGATWPGSAEIQCVASNAYGSVSSTTVELDVLPASVTGLPAIQTPPTSQNVAVGANATFSVVTASSLPVTYQWNFNGTPIAGATSSGYTVTSATAANAGSYTVTVTNANGPVTSAGGVLGVSGAGAPALGSQPQSQTMASGSTATLSVSASGTVTTSSVTRPGVRPAATTTTYQWYLNGVPLAGATKATLLIPNVSVSNAGSYACLVSNAAGSSLSNAAILSVTTTADPGRIINISCRAQVGTGSNVLIAGLVLGGSGTAGPTSLLIRASGPALVPYGVAGALPDPQLQLNSGSTTIASNNGWAGNATVAGTAAALGAFPWTSNSSHDAALVESAPAGAYTAGISGAGGDTGVGLVEVYDATPAGAYVPTMPRLINISARVQVGSGGNVLIAGFVIGGSTSKTVLIRASGPALVPYGVSGTLPDPQLQLFTGTTLLAANNGWSGDSQIASTAAAVGAFTWTSPASNDSALLVTLPPGAYTAQVAGASGDTGVALVEVYEVP